jgi:hypothetical protein
MLARHFATIVATLCISALAHTTASVAKDKCLRDNSLWHEKLEGYNPGGLKFKYESRAQKYSSTSFEYIWCIENMSNNIGHFQWGTRDDEGKYFDALVAPGTMEPTIRTDNSGKLKENRIIQFKSGDTKFQRISPDPQTIFYRNIGKIQIPKVGELHLAQGSVDQRLAFYKTSDGLVDIARLSENRELFTEFVRQEGKIEFLYSAVATLPTNKTAAFTLEANKYEKYDPRDFARLRIVLRNQIEVDRGAPVSRISLSMTPANRDDEAGLASAVEQLPFVFALTPSEAGLGIAKELALQQPITTRFTRVLLERYAGPLRNVSTRMTISVGKLSLFSFPINILVSERQRS